MRPLTPISIFFLLLLSCAGQKGFPEEFQGKVMKVLDGDSLILETGEKNIEVRLFGIDCPEKGQRFADRSRSFTMKKALGKQITLRPVEKDRYERWVGWAVLPDGTNLNHLLVSEGLAWWYRRYAPDDGELRKLEAAARSEKKGLWSRSKPVPPWRYRANQRKQSGLGSEERSLEDDPHKTDASSAADQPIVYTSATDTRFHSENCPALKRVDGSMSLRRAMLSGYGPCSRCGRNFVGDVRPSAPSDRPASRAVISRGGGPPYIAIVRPQRRTAESFFW